MLFETFSPGNWYHRKASNVTRICDWKKLIIILNTMVPTRYGFRNRINTHKTVNNVRYSNIISRKQHILLIFPLQYCIHRGRSLFDSVVLFGAHQMIFSYLYMVVIKIIIKSYLIRKQYETYRYILTWVIIGVLVLAAVNEQDMFSWWWRKKKIKLIKVSWKHITEYI